VFFKTEKTTGMIGDVYETVPGEFKGAALRIDQGRALFKLSPVGDDGSALLATVRESSDFVRVCLEETDVDRKYVRKTSKLCKKCKEPINQETDCLLHNECTQLLKKKPHPPRKDISEIGCCVS
jgi:hypothetical protein